MEVDSEGKTVHLTELLLRSQIAQEIQAVVDTEKAAYAALGNAFDFTPEQQKALCDLVSEEDLTVLSEFLKADVDESRPYCVLLSDKLNLDKNRRRSFHSYVREQFGTFLSTDTFEGDNTRSVRVWIKKYHSSEQDKYKNSKKRKFPNASHNKEQPDPSPDSMDQSSTISVGVMMKDPWPKDRPDYLHFHLYKENRDTAEAIQSIARCLRIPPKSFQFAGTKDRRGVTVQGVSVYRISIDAMKRAILHSAWDKAVRISDLVYKKAPLRIGGSSGNRFRIALKRVTFGEDQTDSTIESEKINNLFNSFKDNGFYNYYGNQRFGTRAVRTHHVGAMLLARDWKGVVDSLLSVEADNMVNGTALPTETSTTADSGSNDRIQWRKEYSAGNVTKAYEMCPPYMYIEKSILRTLHLSNQATNYLNAIQSLPNNTVQLYLHAVQSLVFNAALSERVGRYGRTVVVGDLIQDVDRKVHIVESEADAEKFQFDQVVLPLVGNSVAIPPNMLDFYNEFFQSKLQIGGSIEVLTNPASGTPKFLVLSGAYRNVISKPKDLTWTVVPNVKSAYVILNSDVDVLKGIDRILTPKESSEAPSEAPSGTAVVFECTLDSGVYLTMAVREVSSVSESSSKRSESNESTIAEDD